MDIIQFDPIYECDVLAIVKRLADHRVRNVNQLLQIGLPKTHFRHNKASHPPRSTLAISLRERQKMGLIDTFDMQGGESVDTG